MSANYLSSRLQELGLSGVAEELNKMSKKEDKSPIPSFYVPTPKSIEDNKTNFLY